MDRSALRIVSVGETTIDEYMDLKQEYVGGISLNFAVQSKRSGADHVSLVSCVGSNDRPRVVEKLAIETVDASRVHARFGSTARQKIQLTANGERIFPPDGYDSGVLKGWQLDESDLSFVREHDVMASALFRQTEQLFQQTMEIPFEGWHVADFLDLSDYDRDPAVIEKCLNRLKIAFVSGDEELVERVRILASQRQTLIVVTLGANGSAAIFGNEVFYEPAVNVDTVVDSTGCGDAFQAAFTVAYWRDENVQHALTSGAQQAAITIQHHGAT